MAMRKERRHYIKIQILQRRAVLCQVFSYINIILLQNTFMSDNSISINQTALFALISERVVWFIHSWHMKTRENLFIFYLLDDNNMSRKTFSTRDFCICETFSINFNCIFSAVEGIWCCKKWIVKTKWNAHDFLTTTGDFIKSKFSKRSFDITRQKSS